MAYPFAKAPTVAQAVAAFQALGATLHNLPDPELVGPRGPVVVRYLERGTGNGGIYRSEPLPETDDERVGWDMLRRWCRQLRVDPKELDLGLDLG